MSVEIILVDGRRKLLRARRGWRVREVMTEKSISWGEISALIVDRLRPTFESLSVHYFNPPPPRKGRKVGERMEPAISHPTLSLLPQKSKPSSFLPWGPLFPFRSIDREGESLYRCGLPWFALLFETAAAQLWFLLKARQYNFRREPPRARREGTSAESNLDH